MNLANQKMAMPLMEGATDWVNLLQAKLWEIWKLHSLQVVYLAQAADCRAFAGGLIWQHLFEAAMVVQGAKVAASIVLTHLAIVAFSSRFLPSRFDCAKKKNVIECRMP
jgi:hypothetical protein